MVLNGVGIGVVGENRKYLSQELHCHSFITSLKRSNGSMCHRRETTTRIRIWDGRMRPPLKYLFGVGLGGTFGHQSLFILKRDSNLQSP